MYWAITSILKDSTAKAKGNRVVLWGTCSKVSYSGKELVSIVASRGISAVKVPKGPPLGTLRDSMKKKFTTPGGTKPKGVYTKFQNHYT